MQSSFGYTEIVTGVSVLMTLCALYYAYRQNKQSKELKKRLERLSSTIEEVHSAVVTKQQYIAQVVRLYQNANKSIRAFTTAWNKTDELENAIFDSSVEEFVFCGPIDVATIGRVLWRLKLSERRVKKGKPPIEIFHANMSTIGMKYIIADKEILLSYSKGGHEGSSRGLLVPDPESSMIVTLSKLFSKVIGNPLSDRALRKVDYEINRQIKEVFGPQGVQIDRVITHLYNRQLKSDEIPKDLFEDHLMKMADQKKIEFTPEDRFVRCLEEDDWQLSRMSEFLQDCLPIETFEAMYPKWSDVISAMRPSTSSLSLMSVLYSLSGEHQNVIDAATEAMTFSGTAPERAIVYNNLGHALKEGGVNFKNGGISYKKGVASLFADAEKHFKRSIELNPEFGQAKKNIGILYFRMAENSDDNHAEYWNKAASILEEHENESEKFKLEGKGSRTYLECLYTLSRLYGVWGNKEKAGVYLEKAMNLPGHFYKEWYTAKEYVLAKYKIDQDYYFFKIKSAIDPIIQSYSVPTLPIVVI